MGGGGAHERGEGRNHGGNTGEVPGRGWGMGSGAREGVPMGEEDLAMDRRYHGLGGRGGVRRGEDPWGGMGMGACEGRSHRLGH